VVWSWLADCARTAVAAAKIAATDAPLTMCMVYLLNQAVGFIAFSRW
jgi:hypothetical protein